MRCLFVLIFLTAANIQAQVQDAATPFSGMADVDCASFSPWCVFSNQAGISRTDRIAVGVSYRQVLGLHELSTKSLFALLPTRWGVPAITYSHFGYEKYNEQLIGLAYGRRLGRFLNIGVKIDYLYSFVAKQPQVRQAFFFETGILIALPENILCGLHVYNPGDIARLTAPKQLYVAETYTIAVSWQPDSMFLLAMQSDRIDGVWYFSVGTAFTYNNLLTFRGGLKNRYNKIYAGVGCLLDFMELTLDYNIHPQRGNTLGISLCGKF